MRATRSPRINDLLWHIDEVVHHLRHPVMRFPFEWRVRGWYRFAYCDIDRDLQVYALPGLHWVLIAWKWWLHRRWTLERWGVYAGFYDLEEGGFYRDGRWTLWFWRVRERRIEQARQRGQRSAEQFAAREYRRGFEEGIAAERARFGRYVEDAFAELRAKHSA